MSKCCLNINEIKKNLLQVGKYYDITTSLGRKRTAKFKAKLIECYPWHYVFETENKRKHSFMKVDYHLGEWICKEVK